MLGDKVQGRLVCWGTRYKADWSVRGQGTRQTGVLGARQTGVLWSDADWNDGGKGIRQTGVLWVRQKTDCSVAGQCARRTGV